ncbi:MAG: hypothetical protein AAGC57_03840 [Pseudomonadota bacterium]
MEEEELIQCVDNEAKTLKKKTEKQVKQIEEKLKEKKRLEKDKSKEAQKKIIDIDKATKQYFAQLQKEMLSSSGRIEQMLKQKPPAADDKNAFKGIEKKLEGVISKNGLKVADNIWLKPKIDVKKKKFGMTMTIKF